MCSSDLNESVGNRVDVRFEDGGEVSVKNVARPIRVWKWRPGDAPTAATAPAEPPEPDRQSIAVLPFTNMSGDAEQEYFSDGITEDIITDLSKVAGLLVIARNSSFAYKGKNTDIRAVGRELGVRSVLEGSIRRAGNRVRITAQLIDAANGGHLWAERYHRDLTDIFAVQDEVTRHIVAALKVKLAPAEADHIAEAPTRNLEAHDLVLRARDFLTGRVTDRGSFEKVVVLFTRAIELDANYGEAYAGLAMAQVLNYQNRWTDAANPLEEASRLAARAIATAAHSPYAHYAAAVAALWTRDLDRARQEAEIALALSPNFANGQGVRGLVEVYLGNPLAAVPFLERAIRLDPAFAQQEIGRAHV